MSKEITKTYQSRVTPIFSTYITVKGVRRNIRFAGGKAYPKRSYGKFSTSDPDLIKALEESRGFGKDWICISSTEQPETPETTKEESGEKEITEPKTVREAKDYLNKHFEIPYTQLQNRDAVMKVAGDLKIKFVNVN
jgi:hypothetical protein